MSDDRKRDPVHRDVPREEIDAERALMPQNSLRPELPPRGYANGNGRETAAQGADAPKRPPRRRRAVKPTAKPSTAPPAAPAATPQAQPPGDA